MNKNAPARVVQTVLYTTFVKLVFEFMDNQLEKISRDLDQELLAQFLHKLVESLERSTA